MALESRRRNLHAGQIPELAARLPAAVGTRGVRIKAFRAGRDVLAFQIQRPVQRETAAAAPAAAETAPLDPDRSEARPERLPDPAVTVHPPAAMRAGRGRKIGVERLQQRREARRPAARQTVADRRLDGVQIRNPAAPQLRPHPRKRTAERRRDRRMQRIHLRGWTAGRRSRLELATMHPAALAPSA